MALSIQQKKTTALTVSNDQPGEKFDITNYSGVCVSVTCPVGAAGTMQLQMSNDGSNWVDITGATATIAAQHVLVNVGSIHAATIRPLMDISAGAGDYVFNYLAKDF